MKRFLAILLTVVCVLSVTACTSISKDDAEATVKEFFDAFKELDGEKIAPLLDDPDKMPKELTDFDNELEKSLTESMPENMKDYKDDFMKMADVIVDKICSYISYEIKETTVKGSEATVVVSLTIPKVDEIDKDDLMAAFQDEEAITDITKKLISSGKITASSTQEQLIEALMPEIVKFAVDVIEDMKIETETKELNVVVYSKDGKLLINAEKSNLND